jgi:hypothetical protein
MALTKAERERVSDSMMKIQSAAQSLRKVNPSDIPEFEEIESCLEDADRNLRSALPTSDTEALLSKPKPDKPE